jgi:hypothetical protein
MLCTFARAAAGTLAGASPHTCALSQPADRRRPSGSSYAPTPPTFISGCCPGHLAASFGGAGTATPLARYAGHARLPLAKPGRFVPLTTVAHAAPSGQWCRPATGSCTGRMCWVLYSGAYLDLLISAARFVTMGSLGACQLVARGCDQAFPKHRSGILIALGAVILCCTRAHSGPAMAWLAEPAAGSVAAGGC